jgi:hypothetical protein
VILGLVLLHLYKHHVRFLKVFCLKQAQRESAEKPSKSGLYNINGTIEN